MDRAPAAAPASGDDWVALSADPLPVAAASGVGGAPGLRRHGHLHRHRARPRRGPPGRPPPRVRGLRGARRSPGCGALAAEVRSRWPVVGRVALLHRTGVVELGDAAVVVAVSAPHRGEAFEAARFAIDELKRTVPIWKREAWDGGESWGLEAQHLTEVGTRLMQAVLFLAIVVVVCAIGGAGALRAAPAAEHARVGHGRLPAGDGRAGARPPTSPQPKLRHGQAAHAPQPAPAVRPTRASWPWPATSPSTSAPPTPSSTSGAAASCSTSRP